MGNHRDETSERGAGRCSRASRTRGATKRRSGTGNDFTPNALINAAGSQDRFRTWQAKLNGTMSLPRGFRVVPVMRHQSGQPFARTFVQTLNYGNATIKAEPIAANRTPDISLVDLRTEKGVPRQRRARHGIFRRVQHLQHQCRADADHQLRRRPGCGQRRSRGLASSGSAPEWNGSRRDRSSTDHELGHHHLVDGRVGVPHAGRDLFPGLVHEPHRLGPSPLFHDGRLDDGLRVL